MWIIAVFPAIVVLWCIALLCFLLRWWKVGLVVLVVGCVANWYTQSIPVNLFTWRRVKVEKKEEGTIRILEYNICHKDNYLKKNLEHYQQLADFILDKKADILVLPEHMGPHAQKLDSILRANYPQGIYSSMKTGYEEDAVFSKYPILSCRNYRMDTDKILERHPEADSAFVKSSNGGTMIYQVDLEIESRVVTLIYVHLRSNNYDHAKEEADRKRDKLRNVLEQMQYNYAYRAAEAEAICDSCSGNTNPLLICGDFNDVSGSYVLNTLQQKLGLKDAWWERGFGPGFTFDDQHLLLRLDHLLYSKHFDLRGVSLFSKAGFSDHEPLLFDLKLRQ